MLKHHKQYMQKLDTGTPVALMKVLSGWFYKQSLAVQALLVSLAVAVMFGPWLGLTDFNTKGEPREAVVSLSMLQQDDWILPVNNGVDIPYKPVFFHWAGAIAALVSGGEVTEATSRAPSLASFALLAGAMYLFFGGRRRVRALLAVAVTAGCFEMHRAGVNARVDMMLTFWMVAAMFILYKWWEGGLRFASWYPWAAVVCMSAATLTKGPVGIVLPCLAAWVFMLVKGTGLWNSTWRLALLGVSAALLPFLWYYEAWQRGGDAFLKLVLEENFGRMTGGMSYSSHENPWIYNFWITLLGLMPWTLLGLMIFAAGMARYCREARRGSIKGVWRRLRKWSASGNPEASQDMYALVCLVVVMLFFCLPSSKRSVYLMPAYPFIAWWASAWFLSAGRRMRDTVRIYGAVLASACILMEVALVTVALMPAGAVSFKGRHAAANAAMFESLAHMGIWGWVTVGVAFALGAGWFLWRGKKERPVRMLAYEAIVAFSLFIALDAGFQPALLNVKSLKDSIGDIEMSMPESRGKMYEFIYFGESAPANPYHYFELDFYLKDRIGNFLALGPDSGYLAIPREDVPQWLGEFERFGYRFKKVHTLAKPGRKESIDFYRFAKLPGTPALNIKIPKVSAGK